MSLHSSSSFDHFKPLQDKLTDGNIKYLKLNLITFDHSSLVNDVSSVFFPWRTPGAI